MIGKKFYGRVRQLVLSNTAYFPVFLSQYELIAHGFWRGFSYGMVVFHREDYLKLPGFNMTKVGWGEEDVELYQQFLNQKSLTVIRKTIQMSILRSNLVYDQIYFFEIVLRRSRDPDLFHPFHAKKCSNLKSKQFSDCVQTKFSHKASVKTLYGYFYNRSKTRV